MTPGYARPKTALASSQTAVPVSKWDFRKLALEPHVGKSMYGNAT